MAALRKLGGLLFLAAGGRRSRAAADARPEPTFLLQRRDRPSDGPQTVDGSLELKAPAASPAFGANSCRSPQLCFEQAPWHELRGSVTVVDVAPWSFDREYRSPDKDPLWLSSQPGLFQLNGMQGSPDLKGWTAASSSPAKAAVLRSTADVQAAVRFARKHRLAVSVKNTGHEWFGRNSLPGGGHLELWTHPLNSTLWLDDFTPAGCLENVGAVVRLGAGVQHWQLYDEATRHNRTVAGGTCSTVGLIGASLGGGYGDYSRMYGSGASNMVEATAVLADGRVVRASACNEHRDLFRALRGGGGGFAVVAEATFRTHPWMSSFGDVLTKAQLTGNFTSHMERLLGWFDAMTRRGKAKHFGGKIFVYHDKPPPRIFIEVSLRYNGLSLEECSDLVSSLQDLGVECLANPNPWKPDQVFGSDRAPGWLLDWEQYSGGSFWLESFTRYLRLKDLEEKRLRELVLMFEEVAETLGRNEWQSFLSFSLNYGLGGGSETALARHSETTVHPQVIEAIGTVKLTRRHNSFVPRNRSVWEEPYWENLQHARQLLQDLLPDAGSYFQEGDYTDREWSQRYWGSNYPELLATKRKYDPAGFFRCFQCVGSEASPDAQPGAP